MLPENRSWNQCWQQKKSIWFQDLWLQPLNLCTYCIHLMRRHIQPQNHSHVPSKNVVWPKIYVIKTEANLWPSDWLLKKRWTFAPGPAKFKAMKWPENKNCLAFKVLTYVTWHSYKWFLPEVLIKIIIIAPGRMWCSSIIIVCSFLCIVVDKYAVFK